MKKLQLLLAVLLVGNFVYGSDVSKFKRGFIQAIENTVSLQGLNFSEDVQDDNQLGLLYSQNARLKFQYVIDYMNNDQLMRMPKIDVQYSWAGCNPERLKAGAMCWIQIDLFNKLKTVKNETDKDNYIEEAACNVATCYIAIENEDNNLPTCLRNIIENK